MRLPDPSGVLPQREDGRNRARAARPLLSLRAYDIKIYRVCEDLTELLIYCMVIFSPWAFGNTQEWSIWVMNICGYVLGLLLLLKLSIRRLKGYRPARWGTEGADRRL